MPAIKKTSKKATEAKPTPASASPASPAKKPTPSRKPGRPRGVTGRMLDRETVISIAFSLTKTTSVSELSIVRVAKELGVTPALIHYYLAGGGRDALTSGVMNAFYREVIEMWPPQQPDWRSNFEVVAEAVYRAYLRYPGIAIYASAHNRYQLVQEVTSDEIDYGLQMLEKFSGAVRMMGFPAAQTGALAHLLMMFVQAYANSTVKRRWPGEHADFLRAKLSALDPAQYPNCHFVQESLINLNATEAFRLGLRVVMDGLERAREHAANQSAWTPEFAGIVATPPAPAKTPPAPKRRRGAAAA